MFDVPDDAAIIRKQSIERSRQLCQAAGLDLYLSAHFIERVNQRSPNQADTFLRFILAVKATLTKPANNTVSVMVGDETFLLTRTKTLVTAQTFCIFATPRHCADANIKVRIERAKPVESH